MADDFCRHGIQAGNYCAKCGKEVVGSEMALSAHVGALEGLPDDLARVLRDQSIIVPQDQAVFEKIAEWANAPATTLSGMTADEWQDAWSVVQRRVDVLERQLAVVTAERDHLRRHGADWVVEEYKELHAAAEAFLDSFAGHIGDTYESAERLKKALARGTG